MARVVPSQRRRSCPCQPARDAQPVVAADGGRARAGVRGLRSRARGRVRERVERDAGARRVAASRDCCAPVARRQPRTAGAPVADRRPVDRDAGRRRGPDARRLAAARRHGGVFEHAAAVGRRAVAPRAARHRLPRVRVLPGGVRGRTADVCAPAGAPGVAADADGRAARPRRRRIGRLAAPQPAGRQPGRDRHRPGDPGGHAGAQRRGDRRHRPRLQIGGRALDQRAGTRTRRRSGRLAEVLRADPRVAEVAASAGNPLFVRSRDLAASPSDAAGAARHALHVRDAGIFLAAADPDRPRPRLSVADEASAAHGSPSSAPPRRGEFWPNDDPIGKTIRIEPAEGRPVDDLPGYSALTVVGVVRDVVSGFIIDGRDRGHIYLPARRRLAARVGPARARAHAWGADGPRCSTRCSVGLRRSTTVRGSAA